MSDLPAGFFPQLPETVAHPDVSVSSTFGTGYEGHMLNVSLIRTEDTMAPRHALKGDGRMFPSREAVKAYTLARSYTLPWRYLGTSLHPMAR